MNFVVYGQARTGSTLLGALLSTQSQVEYASEMLGRMRRCHHVLRYLHMVAPAYSGTLCALGSQSLHQRHLWIQVSFTIRCQSLPT